MTCDLLGPTGRDERKSAAVDTALLGRLVPGDHVCWLVDDDDTRADGTAVYVDAGLTRNHKVMYCGDDPAGVLAGLEARGVPTGPALATGQLQLSTAEDVYLASGAFAPEATLKSWRLESVKARAEGYRGLQAFGDMSWAGRDASQADRVPWYEDQVNRVVADGFAIGLCLYDRRLFSLSRLSDFTSAHPGVLSAGNSGGPVPLFHVVRTADPVGLRLRGEADLSSRRALRTVLAHLMDDLDAAGRELTFDVSGLQFADGHTARLLADAARNARAVRIVGCTPALTRLLAFHGAGTRPGLTVEAAR